ncbi:MAG TPA: hypothetical protein VF060_23345 [Trebonia sp.]
MEVLVTDPAGPGGRGKTRLAPEATTVPGDCADRQYFAGLAVDCDVDSVLALLTRAINGGSGEVGSRTGELLISLLDEAGKAEVDILLAREEYIFAVCRVRELRGLTIIDIVEPGCVMVAHGMDAMLAGFGCDPQDLAI